MNTSLLLLLVMVFLNIAGFSLILPLLPFYGQSFGVGAVAIAVLFAAYSFGNVFGEMVWGRLSDRHGRRPILIITTAVAALSYIAFAYAPTYAAAVVIRVVSGFFSGTFGVAQGAIADLSAPKDRARFMGYFGAAFNLGFAIGPAIGGLLSQPEQGLAGFRVPVLAAAVLVGLASLWAWKVFQETKVDDGSVRPLPRYSEAMHFVASDSQLIRLFLIAFFGIAAFASMEAVFGLWSESNFGWDSRQLGWVFLAMGGVGLLVQTVLIGPLVSRFGEAKVIALGLLVLVLATVLQPILRSPMAAVALMALLMAGHSITFPNAGAMVSQRTPPDRMGSVMGMNMASNAASRIVIPPLFGALYSVSADAPFYLCSLMMALMLAVSISIIKDTQREKAP